MQLWKKIYVGRFYTDLFYAIIPTFFFAVPLSLHLANIYNAFHYLLMIKYNIGCSLYYTPHCMAARSTAQTIAARWIPLYSLVHHMGEALISMTKSLLTMVELYLFLSTIETAQ